ncbi:carbonic anhydrase [Methylogaea oryzae]|uniref:carbonic anhydrase n=1 Tax=Methylogaea oryzae TaxID=1295382 RepID=A0A8D5AIJ8_9GAMM|nr:carbonic anhydrase family protein [Methylogaea oryzae]BBL71426.1 carbonic anhydrase [Methylogaea oryzae]
MIGNVLALQPTLAADAHVDPHWTYDEQAQWGMLADPIYKPPFPYADCSIGQKQSPVNIERNSVKKLKGSDELKPRYADVPLSLTNNGHTIRANISKGSLYIGKVEYRLLQFHFHSPSEHLTNGVRYPMEIHFVNGTADGKLAVVGVFVEAGQFNQEFQKILDLAPSRTGATVNTPLPLQPAELLPKNTRHFYTYAGSLTTPPCTEGTQWFVLRETIQASQKQIEQFNGKYYRGNARAEQKLNGRLLGAN